MTKREIELLRRAALFVLAGEWPWEPEKSGERETLERAAERLSSAAEPVAQPEHQLNKAAPVPDAAGQQRSGYLCGARTPPPANEGGIPSAATHEPVAQQPPPREPTP